MPRTLRLVAVVVLAALMAFGTAEARSSGHGAGSSHSARSYSGGSHHTRSSSPRHSNRSYSGGSHHGGRARALPGVPRDSHGHVKRSESAKHDFEKQTGYPHGRPGYVVDHITPLARGGADSPSNMQWQTKEEAKAKDKVELGRTPDARKSGKKYWWSRHK